MPDRPGISVVTVRSGVEYYTPIEFGNHRDDLVRHLSVPKLKLSAIFVSPILIQINQYVDSALQIHWLVVVEIGVNRKVAAVGELVEPGSQEIRIWNQTFDPGYIFQNLDEGP